MHIEVVDEGALLVPHETGEALRHGDFEKAPETSLLSHEQNEEQPQESYSFCKFISKHQLAICLAWAGQSIPYAFLNWQSAPGIQKACLDGVQAALNQTSVNPENKLVVLEGVAGVVSALMVSPPAVLKAAHLASISGEIIGAAETWNETCRGARYLMMSAVLVVGAYCFDLFVVQPWSQKGGLDLQYSHGYNFASVDAEPCKHAIGLPEVAFDVLNIITGAIAAGLTLFSFKKGFSEGRAQKQAAFQEVRIDPDHVRTNRI